MVLARKPVIGTVANNVLTYGVGGLNIDGSRVGSEEMPAQVRGISKIGTFEGADGNTTPERTGRFPANFIHDGSDEVVALFPDTGKSTGGRIGKKSMGDVTNVPAGEYEAGDPGYGDSGSAARFFYCAKASKRDRNEGLDGFEKKITNDITPPGTKGSNSPRAGAGRSGATANHHPTVKPTTLMQYLVRLVTPPNGIVLDPFMGSGSTGKACAYEGFNFIGIDQSAEYVEIARARIAFAQSDDE
jgi:site-specific DNA-methyltransferase (adenine-specific)